MPIATEKRRHLSANPARAAFMAALLVLVLLGMVGLLPGTGSSAGAQTFSLSLGGETDGEVSVAERAIQLLVLLTVISLAPSILVMVTSFTRIIVVLSLLRTALGLQQSPPNSVLISLALFLTVFIMAPTLEASYDAAVVPLLADELNPQQAFEAGSAPLRDFMMMHVREQDIALFLEAAGEDRPQTADDVPLRTLIPAFMLSELRRAFEIGFVIFVPFLIIDIVVSSVLMSMGMMMLPPVIISLPFKIIFFVLVDGWWLVAGTLLSSYGTITP